jgi:hypothetical protein
MIAGNLDKITSELASNNFFVDSVKGLICKAGIVGCVMSKSSSGDGNYTDGIETLDYRNSLNNNIINLGSPNLSNQSSYSSYGSSMAVYTGPRKVAFYGFIGGSEIMMGVKIDYDSIDGEYFSKSENKSYKVQGNFVQDNNYSSANGGYSNGTIVINELEDGRLTGKFNFDSETPDQAGNYNVRIPAGLFYSKYDKPLDFKTLSGSYTDANGKYYDTYLTTNESIIKNWTVENIKGKLAKPKSNYQGGGTPEYYFILGDDGVNYFTRDIAKFKDIEDGKTVQVKTKYRKYNQMQSYYEGGNPYECNNGSCPQPINTKLGLFQVESVKVVE